MKRHNLKSGIFLIISLLVTQAFSRSVTFYGLESIQHYHGSSRGTFFIQLGNFATKLNAYHFQKRMQAKINYPLKIERKGLNYVVVIGPLNSITEVREVAFQARTRFVHKQIPEPPSSRFTRIKQNILKAAGPMTEKNMQLEKDPVDHFALIYENWYIGTLGGVQWNNVGQKITVNTQLSLNQNMFLFTINNQRFAGASGGYRVELNNCIVPAFSLGIRYHHVFSRGLGKSVLHSSLPEFNNSSKWRIYSDVALATAKINFFQYRAVATYLAGALGAAFNKTRSTNEAGIVAPSRVFFADNNLTTQFAFNLGAGVDFQLSSRFIVSIGYEHQDLGKVSSSSGVGILSGHSHRLGNYKSDAALLGVNYLIGDR